MWMDESMLEYYGLHCASKGVLDVGYAMYKSFQYKLKLSGPTWGAMGMLVSTNRMAQWKRYNGKLT
jgi:hypothetical protein